MKFYHYCTICIYILFISCSSSNDKRQTNTKDFAKVQKNSNIISNENMNIETIDLITVYITYGFHGSTYAFGVDSNKINERLKNTLPDSIENIDELPLKYIPVKKYLTQDALDYLSQYMIGQCDTVMFEYFYENENNIFYINLYGKKGEIACVYGDQKRIIEYFQGMLNWIEQYRNQDAFKELIPTIEQWIQIRR